MIRLTMLAMLGVGYAAMPHGVWLVAMVVMLAATTGADWWRRRRPDLALRVAATERHFHYCTDCDRQWRHAGDGPACTQHWASTCPDCETKRRESTA